MLKPDAWKLARPVSRGERGSNAPALPDCSARTKEDAFESAEILSEWLKERGLTLSKEKTRIVHLSEGFNFLGFNVRHYRMSSTKTGWKLLIKPSAETMQEIRGKLRQIWLENIGKNVAVIIKILNPVLPGNSELSPYTSV